MVTDLQVLEQYTVLSVFGDLDFTVEQELKDAWMEALAGHPLGLLVDLSHVPLLDSTGVRLLLSGCQRTRDRGAYVAILLGAESHVGRVLELMGLTRVLPVFYERETALGCLWNSLETAFASVTPESSGDRQATHLDR